MLHYLDLSASCQLIGKTLCRLVHRSSSEFSGLTMPALQARARDLFCHSADLVFLHCTVWFFPCIVRDVGSISGSKKFFLMHFPNLIGNQHSAAIFGIIHQEQSTYSPLGQYPSMSSHYPTGGEGMENDGRKRLNTSLQRTLSHSTIYLFAINNHPLSNCWRGSYPYRDQHRAQ